jgi:hypothetical protein
MLSKFLKRKDVLKRKFKEQEKINNKVGQKMTQIWEHKMRRRKKMKIFKKI